MIKNSDYGFYVLFALLILSFVTILYLISEKNKQYETVKFSPEDSGIISVTINKDSTANIKAVFNKDTFNLSNLYQEDLELLLMFLYEEERTKFIKTTDTSEFSKTLP
jgi:hypothetical protein